MALTGSTTREQAYNFFKAQGLTDAGTFGLMANIDAESNFRADNLQNTYEKKGRRKQQAQDRQGYGLQTGRPHGGPDPGDR